MSRELGSALRALHAKQITFSDFYRQTRVEWRRMSAALYKAYRLPPTVTRDDVEQEMLLWAWHAITKWDPHRPNAASLDGYVIWTAHEKAEKWIHKQRSVNQHRRKGPSGFACCLAMLSRTGEGESRVLQDASVEGPERERVLDASAILAALPSVSPTEAGKQALRQFVAHEGDEDAAAAALYGNVEHRYLFRLKNRAQARALVRSEVRFARRAILEG
jgi:hypothetical protein